MMSETRNSQQPKKPTKFSMVNTSPIDTKVLKRIAEKLTKDSDIPNFYLICKGLKHDGISITNIDKPIVLIDVHNSIQFERVLKHELIHLKQHQKGYANEHEAYFDKELVVTK